MIPIDADHIKSDGDGRAWWVVDDVDLVGEPCVMLEAGRGQLIKPLDRPCDTCGGTNEYHTDLMTTEWGKCPDCIDGRHTFEIEVVGAVRYEDGKPTVFTPDHTCRVSVVPGMILPIVDSGTATQTHPGQEVVAIGGRSGPAHCLVPTCPDDPGGANSIPPPSFPSAAVPGMWAVRLKVAP